MENLNSRSRITFLLLGFLMGSGLVGLAWFLQPPQVVTVTQEKTTPSNALREAIHHFQQSKYTPEQSAQEWIKLYNLQRSIAKKGHHRFNPDQVSLSEILLLLPPPLSWSFLEKEMLTQKIEMPMLFLIFKKQSSSIQSI